MRPRGTGGGSVCTLHGTPEVMGKRGCRGRRRSHGNCWIAIRLNCFVQLDARASRAEPAALARPGGRLPGLRGAALIFFSLSFFPLSFIFLFLPFSLSFIYSYSFLSFFFFFVCLSSFLFLFFLPFFFYSFSLIFPFLPFFPFFSLSSFHSLSIFLSFHLSFFPLFLSFFSFPSFFLSFFPFKMSLFRRILEGLTLKFIS